MLLNLLANHTESSQQLTSAGMYRDGNRINIVSQVTEYQSAEVHAQTAEDVQHVCFQFIN